MPSRAWPLWCLTGLLIVGFPALNFVYWPLVLRSGALPADGDSIAIPMFTGVVVATVASPFVVGAAWLSLRRYNALTRFASWRSDRPYRSIIATVVFGGAAVWIAADLARGWSRDLPPYEYLWAVYGGLLVLWLLGLRAAFIEQL